MLQRSYARLVSLKSLKFIISYYTTPHTDLIDTALMLLIFFVATYSFSDVDLDDRSGAEGRLASVPGLHHQGPGAVSLLGDVLNDGHRLDVGLEHDLPCVSVNVKDVVVRFSFHDGILNNIVGYFCIIVYSLCR